jgi:hypothetical protein
VCAWGPSLLAVFIRPNSGFPAARRAAPANGLAAVASHGDPCPSPTLEPWVLGTVPAPERPPRRHCGPWVHRKYPQSFLLKLGTMMPVFNQGKCAASRKQSQLLCAFLPCFNSNIEFAEIAETLVAYQIIRSAIKSQITRRLHWRRHHGQQLKTEVKACL